MPVRCVNLLGLLAEAVLKETVVEENTKELAEEALKLIKDNGTEIKT